jgi:hypothetical protein
MVKLNGLLPVNEAIAGKGELIVARKIVKKKKFISYMHLLCLLLCLST